MRWEQLFGDLAAQFDAAEAADLSSEVADRTRREWATTQLSQRLLASCGAHLRVTVAGGAAEVGVLSDAGPDWLLLATGRAGATAESLVPLSAVTSISGLGGHSAAELGTVERTLTLGWALRAVVRDRAPVTLVLTDASTLCGTLDRVGADYVDLAEHPLDEPRRDSALRGVRTVPLSALGVVRRR